MNSDKCSSQEEYLVCEVKYETEQQNIAAIASSVAAQCHGERKAASTVASDSAATATTVVAHDNEDTVPFSAIKYETKTTKSICCVPPLPEPRLALNPLSATRVPTAPTATVTPPTAITTTASKLPHWTIPLPGVDSEQFGALISDIRLFIADNDNPNSSIYLKQGDNDCDMVADLVPGLFSLARNLVCTKKTLTSSVVLGPGVGAAKVHENPDTDIDSLSIILGAIKIAMRKASNRSRLCATDCSLLVRIMNDFASQLYKTDADSKHIANTCRLVCNVMLNAGYLQDNAVRLVRSQATPALLRTAESALHGSNYALVAGALGAIQTLSFQKQGRDGLLRISKAIKRILAFVRVESQHDDADVVRYRALGIVRNISTDEECIRVIRRNNGVSIIVDALKYVKK
jgi:hypothetical protein